MTVSTSSPFSRWSYMIIGVIATIAYRIVIVLTHADPIYLTVAWYIGTIGFIIYFAHRYKISIRRAKLISDQQLAKKVSTADCFSQEDKEAMAYIFQTLLSTKEKWNYYVIFVTSAIALIIGVYLDFF